VLMCVFCIVVSHTSAVALLTCVPAALCSISFVMRLIHDLLAFTRLPADCFVEFHTVFIIYVK